MLRAVESGHGMGLVQWQLSGHACAVAMIAETACEALHSTKGASTSLNAVGPKK